MEVVDIFVLGSQVKLLIDLLRVGLGSPLLIIVYQFMPLVNHGYRWDFQRIGLPSHRELAASGLLLKVLVFSSLLLQSSLLRLDLFGHLYDVIDVV